MRGIDYYELLGVTRHASTTEIRSAYRSLAKVMHPDAGGTAGAFRLLREAYETLTDPDRRADYDDPNDPDDPDSADEYAEDDLDDLESEAPGFTRRRAGHTPPAPTLDPKTIPWWHEVAARPWWSAVARLATRRADRSVRTEFGPQAVFGGPGDDPDEAAERLTADLVARYLTRIPGVWICHGLAGEAGSVFADVHHAVLRGRRLVLVESKLWLPGHYTADESNVLWRNGHPFRGGGTDLPERVADYQAMLPQLDVRGVLLLYPSRPGTITVTDGPAPVPPMVPERFVHEIGGWLAAGPARVDRTALRTLVRQVVSIDP